MEEEKHLEWRKEIEKEREDWRKKFENIMKDRFETEGKRSQQNISLESPLNQRKIEMEMKQYEERMDNKAQGHRGEKIQDIINHKQAMRHMKLKVEAEDKLETTLKSNNTKISINKEKTTKTKDNQPENKGMLFHHIFKFHEFNIHFLFLFFY